MTFTAPNTNVPWVYTTAVHLLQDGVMPADAVTRKALLRHWQRLAETDRATLLSFAEFLAARADPVEFVVAQPQHEPRPGEETVVGAVKRLSRVYHMVDRSRMLGETSALMSQHIIEGRDAAEIIDELERAFERHYQVLVQSR